MDITHMFLENELAKYLDPLKPEFVLTEDEIKIARYEFGAIEYPIKPVEERAEKTVIFCEDGENVIGFIEVLYYNFNMAEIKKKNAGTINQIFVRDGYRDGEASYFLLKKGVQKLLEKGFKNAVLNVDDDNPNRFFHFAMADGNVVDSEMIERTNGDFVYSHKLKVDLNKLNNMSLMDLVKKTAKMKKQASEIINEQFK